MRPIVFMFSGQGSHYHQMGKALFSQNEFFRAAMLKADRICQDIIKISVIEHLYAEHHHVSQPFLRTLLTHPAIFMVEYALSQLLLAQGISPTAVLGTSLGEFAASVLAGVISFETALTAVITQAQMLEDHCQVGSMLAVLGQPVAFYYESSLLQQNSELAAINFDGSFVVADNLTNIKAIEQFLKSQEITYQQLNVSHAFHSVLINPAAPYYLDFIRQQVLRSPVMPFISATYAKSLTDITFNHFWNIVRSPIQFQATIQALEEQNNYYYLDVGPSGTLATFVKYNLAKNSTSKFFSVLTPFSRNLEEQNIDNLKYALLS